MECRICYEEETANNVLITPCLCSGSRKFVHLNCLEIWRQYNGTDIKKCTECHAEYKFGKMFPLEKYTINFLTLKQNILLEFLTLQAIILSPTLVIYHYKDSSTLSYFHSYVMSASILFFFINFLFFIKIYSKLHRKYLYTTLIWKELLLFFLFNIHFIWVFFLTPILFEIYIETILCFVVYTPICSMMYLKHNNILDTINTKRNFNIIINY